MRLPTSLKTGAMALPKDFPKSPHAILDSGIRWGLG